MSVTPHTLRAFLERHAEAVFVEVTEAKGSTPREAGAWMLVAPHDTIGTIGGGQLEFLAIKRARDAKVPGGVEARHVPMQEALVRDAPRDSCFVVMTHDHGLDFLIASEALSRGDAAYVGMIGSKTKKATFRSWLSDMGQDTGLLEGLTMPIGGADVDDKRPEIIAALTAAEIVRATAHRANFEA